MWLFYFNLCAIGSLCLIFTNFNLQTSKNETWKVHDFEDTYYFLNHYFVYIKFYYLDILIEFL